MDLMSVIKMDTNSEVLSSRYPDEAFYGDTKLIVRNSQEAIMFQNGQILENYTPGKHTLTKQKPRTFLQKLFRIKPKAESYTHSEIYFINKMDNLNVRWKTENPVVVRDAEMDLLMNVSADGQFAIKVEDARLLMMKLVGSVGKYTKEDFNRFFRGRLMSIIKEKMVTAIQRDAISFLDMAKHTDKISKAIQEALKPHAAEYGIAISKFHIESMGVDPEDYRKLQEMKQESIMNEARVKDLRYKEEQLGEAKASIRKDQDYTYQEERRFDVLEALAQRTTLKDDTFAKVSSRNMGDAFSESMNNEISHETEEGLNDNKNNDYIPKASGQSQKVENFCSICESENNADAKYCSMCGEELATA